MRHALASWTFNVVNEGLHAGVHGISRHVFANLEQTVLHAERDVQGAGILVGASNVLLSKKSANDT
jgi:hypothetical protein